MQRLIIYILLSLAFTIEAAMAEAPVVWSGQFAKSLATSGFMQASGRQLRDCGATDPSAGAGIVAPRGSICQYDSGVVGSLFVKSGAANNAWTNVLTAASGWSLFGNAGTDDTLNFMGTTDAEDVVFKVNNTEFLRILQAGPVLVKDSVQFEDPGAGVNAVSVTSPTPLAASYTLTLPPDMGTNNYVFTTNGVSTTSWQDVNSLVSPAWLLLGNAGTNDAVNFMGTTDAQDVVFKANNAEVMRIENTGASLLVGTTAPVPFAISAVRSSADPVGGTGGMYSILNTSRTVNGGSLSSAVQGDSRGQVDVGITDSLGNIGGLFNAYRNIGAADAGTMGYLVGIYGGSMQTNTAGITSVGAGVFTQSNWSTGTVTDAYDFYAAPATVGATITNRYGIFVAPDVVGKINYLADRLAIGASYTPPTHTLEVQNGVMTQNSAVTDTPVSGGFFTDSNHTTVDGSNNVSGVQALASATVDALATNDKAVSGTLNTAIRGDGTDDGTLEELNGESSVLIVNSGAAGITNKVVSYDTVQIYQGAGATLESYDMRAQSVLAGGVAPTTQYGLYINPGIGGGVKKSWLADRSVLGGTSFSSPNASLDVNGDLAFRMTADASVGVVTALSTTSTSAIRLTGAGAVTLQGIAGGVDGKILTLSNQTGAVLTVANQNGGAGATDRIITGTGASMSISNDAALVLQYDATQQKWLVIAAPSSGGGGGGTASVKFTLSGAVVPYEAIDGVHNQTTIQSLTNVYVSALNSGTSGTTVVRVNQYRAGALIDSQTASLASNAGLPDGSFAALSGTLSLQVGDIISVDVDSAAAGASELSVEY